MSLLLFTVEKKMEQEVQERIIKKYNDICELLAEEIMLPNLTQEQNDEFEKITEVVCAIAYRKKKVFELMEELIEMGEDYFEKKVPTQIEIVLDGGKTSNGK